MHLHGRPDPASAKYGKRRWCRGSICQALDEEELRARRRRFRDEREYAESPSSPQLGRSKCSRGISGARKANWRVFGFPRVHGNAAPTSNNHRHVLIFITVNAETCRTDRDRLTALVEAAMLASVTGLAYHLSTSFRLEVRTQ